jgi:hypothetical protein
MDERRARQWLCGRARDPVKMSRGTGQNAAVQGIQCNSTGCILRENPVELYWIRNGRGIQCNYTESSPHGQSSRNLLDEPHATNPVKIYWIACMAYIQCKFTGLLGWHQSSEYPLDGARVAPLQLYMPRKCTRTYMPRCRTRHIGPCAQTLFQ